MESDEGILVRPQSGQPTPPYGGALDDHAVLEQLKNGNDKIVLWEFKKYITNPHNYMKQIIYCVSTDAYYYCVWYERDGNKSIAYRCELCEENMNTYYINDTSNDKYMRPINKYNKIGNIHVGFSNGINDALGNFIWTVLVPNQWSHPIINEWLFAGTLK